MNAPNNPFRWFLILLVFARLFVDAESPASLTLTPAAQDHVDWFISLLNGAETFDETDYQRRFAADFIAQVPADVFLSVVEGMVLIDGESAESWSVGDILVSVPNGAIVRFAPATGEPAFLLNLSVDGDGKVDGLLVSPADFPTLDDPPTTVSEAANRLDALGHNFAFLVADEACTMLAGSAEDEVTPIGSMFKFYVLGAVVDAIRNESITWTQSVDIVDQYRSLPSGIVQNDPPGSNRTVRDLAELMISISDNTATDHLMALVGRTAVEQALQDYGHHMPELNKPFLSTREAFILKLGRKTDTDDAGAPGPVGQTYLAADSIEERRIILSELKQPSLDALDISVWTLGPIAVEEIEWFASPRDLCNVLSLLHENEEAARILGINPGIPDDDKLWSYIGFKGGSEPGVLGLSWYLEAAGGSHRVVTGTVWNPDEAIEDEVEAMLLLGAIRDLSLKEAGKDGTKPPTLTLSMSSGAIVEKLPAPFLLGPTLVFSILSLLHI